MSAQNIITIAGIIFGSVGFWNLIIRLADRKSARSKLIMGLAYSEICNRAEEYIDRGSITLEEYADLNKYLWTPYHDMGGNGTCARLMAEVDKLPIKED